VQPTTTCRASLIAEAEAAFNGPLTVSMASEDGSKGCVSQEFSGFTLRLAGESRGDIIQWCGLPAVLFRTDEGK